MRSNTPTQVMLLQKIKSVLPANISFVDQIAELLEISNDSAYRRIRGETALSVEEITILCSHFKFSFDAFIGNNMEHAIIMSYSALTDKKESFTIHLQRLNDDFEQAVASKEKEIIYAADEVPVFNYFGYRELAAFKIFYWLRSIMGVKEFEGKKFDFNIIDKNLLDTAQSIYEKIQQIPSVEIWNEDTFNSSVKQLEYYYESGMFTSKDDALLICNQLRKMMEQIKKQTENGFKLNPKDAPTDTEPNYRFYQSEVTIGTNTILVKLGGNQAAYISFNTFNALSTNNSEFCNNIKLWLNNIIKKSTLISGVSEKHRHRFFSQIFKMIDLLEEKIKND